MPIASILAVTVLASAQEARSWFPDQTRVAAKGWAHTEPGEFRTEVVGVRTRLEDGAVSAWAPDGGALATPFPAGLEDPRFGEVQVWSRVEYPLAMAAWSPRGAFSGTPNASPRRSQSRARIGEPGKTRVVELVSSQTLSSSPSGDLTLHVPVGLRCVARYEYAARRWTQNFTGTRLTAAPAVRARREGTSQIVYSVRLNVVKGVDQPIGQLEMRNGRTVPADVSDTWTPGQTTVNNVFFFPAHDRRQVRAFEMKAAETVAVTFRGLRLAPPAAR